MNRHFSFENLRVWQEAIAISDDLLELADAFEQKKHYRFAEQLRGATLSISNNIAEGAGDDSPREFRKFLKYARRSAFECANIVIISLRREYITVEQKEKIYARLDALCRQLSNFRKYLESKY